MFSLKYFVIGMSLGAILLVTYIVSLPDHRLHIVFCDVGQGDAEYIKMPSGQDMLIDGGPDDSVLSCLGRHMPFYDRTIDVLMLTHPQKDHMQGLLSVIDRYKTNYMIIGEEGNNTDGYKELISKLKEHGVPTRNLFARDSFKMGQTDLTIVWPERDWVISNVDTDTRIIEQSSIPKGGAVMGLSTQVDLNQFSYFLKLSYGNFDALFTGDGDSPIQPTILNEENLTHVEVLKYPHHGSKTGLLPEFLDRLSPTFTVISVGQNNSYGHPSPDALAMLKSHGDAYKRTDEYGDIEVISDGKKWWVTTERNFSETLKGQAKNVQYKKAYKK